MKTFFQFKQEMEAAVSNIQEAEGFKSSGTKKKKKKKKFGSKRDQKIADLKRRSGQDGKKVSWAGLEEVE